MNHLAFDAEDADALDRARDRWQDHGLDVVRIDHGRSLSIYAEDPNGNTIEWCWQHEAFTDEDAAGAVGRACSVRGPSRRDPGPCWKSSRPRRRERDPTPVAFSVAVSAPPAGT